MLRRVSRVIRGRLGQVAQLVTATENPRVGGSIPPWPQIRIRGCPKLMEKPARLRAFLWR